MAAPGTAVLLAKRGSTGEVASASTSAASAAPPAGAAPRSAATMCLVSACLRRHQHSRPVTTDTISAITVRSHLEERCTRTQPVQTTGPGDIARSWVHEADAHQHLMPLPPRMPTSSSLPADVESKGSRCSCEQVTQQPTYLKHSVRRCTTHSTSQHSIQHQHGRVTHVTCSQVPGEC